MHHDFFSNEFFVASYIEALKLTRRLSRQELKILDRAHSPGKIGCILFFLIFIVMTKMNQIETRVEW